MWIPQNKKSKMIVNFILDQSGSMNTVKSATISGFNEYIQSLKNDSEGEYEFTLTLFNTIVKTPYVAAPISSVEPLNTVSYQPDGGTALYDAVCMTINTVKGKVKDNEKSVVVILTDGEENSSLKFTSRDFRDLVESLQAKGNWSFVYLGANQDAWNNANKWGFMHGNVVTYTSSLFGTQNAFTVSASATRAFNVNATNTTANSTAFFTKEQKADIEKK